jgi:hypothetical protein
LDGKNLGYNAQMIQRSDNTCELTINERNICIITTF